MRSISAGAPIAGIGGGSTSRPIWRITRACRFSPWRTSCSEIPSSGIFTANPPLRAAELLLQEKIPLSPPLFIVSSRDRASVLPRTVETAPTEGRFDTPHTPRPRTQLLGHEGYSVMVTNSGGGFSRWGRKDVTRWRSDRTQDSRGTFCYIHDTSTGRIWSNTFHPVGGKVADDYSVQFALDRAVFRRRDEGIDTGTEIFVSAEDDVEIRRITLINRSVYRPQTGAYQLYRTGHGAPQRRPAASGFPKNVHPNRSGPGALGTAGVSEGGAAPKNRRCLSLTG